MTSSLILATLSCMLGAYLLCGIPFGLIVAKGSKGHVDVRTVGSGNIGMTNVARAAGAKAAAATFLLDMGKGALSMAASRLALAHVAGVPAGELGATGAFAPLAALVFLACVCGHVFSPYLRLRGGKGISVGFGAGLVLLWPMSLAALVIFLACVVPTRYVSLGSVAAAVTMPFVGLLLGMRPPAALVVALACALVVWRHKDNILRLRQGSERRLTTREGAGRRDEGEGK